MAAAQDLTSYTSSSTTDERSALTICDSRSSLEMADNISYMSMRGVDSGLVSPQNVPSARSSLASRGSFGYISSNIVIQDISDIHYGLIDISCAEELCNELGEFLIRKGRSSENDLRLTVKKEDGHAHFTIYHDYHPHSLDGLVYFLDDKTRHLMFVHALDLIQYILNTGYLPVIRENLPLHPCSKRNKMVLRSSDIKKGKIVNPNPKSSKKYFIGSYQRTKVVLVEKQQRTKVIREAELRTQLRRVNHPNIVDMIGLSIGELVCLVLPDEAQRSLYNHIKTDGTWRSSKKHHHMTKLSHDICCGMIYLHSINCIHRSLQSRACIVNKSGTAKICDFDKACFTADNFIEPKLGEAVLVPTRWAAPEVLKDAKFSKASDVWSFGILVWEIFNSGVIPYRDLRNEEMIEKLKPGFRLTLTKKQKSHDIILEKCLRYNENNRPSFDFIEGVIHSLL